MARAHLYRPIQDIQGNLRTQAIVRLFDDATNDLTSEPLYAAETGTQTISNPFTSATGVIDLYTETQKRFRVGVKVGDEPEIIFDGVDTIAPEVDSTDAATLQGHPASYFYSPANPPSGTQSNSVALTQASTASTTLTDADSVVFVDQANATITLPTATGRSGRQFVIKNINATPLTVASNGGTIDGDTTRVLLQYDALTVVSNGTIWGVI